MKVVVPAEAAETEAAWEVVVWAAVTATAAEAMVVARWVEVLEGGAAASVVLVAKVAASVRVVEVDSAPERAAVGVAAMPEEVEAGEADAVVAVSAARAAEAAATEAVPAQVAAFVVAVSSSSCHRRAASIPGGRERTQDFF